MSSRYQGLTLSLLSVTMILLMFSMQGGTWLYASWYSADALSKIRGTWSHVPFSNPFLAISIDSVCLCVNWLREPGWTDPHQNDSNHSDCHCRRHPTCQPTLHYCCIFVELLLIGVGHDWREDNVQKGRFPFIFATTMNKGKWYSSICWNKFNVFHF